MINYTTKLIIQFLLFHYKYVYTPLLQTYLYYNEMIVVTCKYMNDSLILQRVGGAV